MSKLFPILKMSKPRQRKVNNLPYARQGVSDRVSMWTQAVNSEPLCLLPRRWGGGRDGGQIVGKSFHFSLYALWYCLKFRKGMCCFCNWGEGWREEKGEERRGREGK